ncbi:MAG: hypothetical protein IT515_10075 [Burkholderiales bacterium]|nr:hypothetical protein [Burkholderiales bacterium]
MKISAQLAIWMSAGFALLCLGFALTGFAALPAITDEAEREVSFGYACFWAFLAGIGTVFGILSWMITKGKLGDLD